MTAYLEIHPLQTETSLWRHSLRTWLRAQPSPAVGRGSAELAVAPAGTGDCWCANQDDHGADAGRGTAS